MGTFIYLPSTQKNLSKAARDLIQQKTNDGIFDNVVVSFSGQEATLTGAVATNDEKIHVEKIVRDDIRLADQFPTRNPVTKVHNLVEINVDKAPFRQSPWLIVSLYGPQQRVDGYVKSATQSAQFFSSLSTLSPNRSTNNQVMVVEKSLPLRDWEKTISAIPHFAELTQGKQGKAAAVIAATNCDGVWKTFTADATNEEIAEFLSSSKVSADVVNRAVKDLRFTYDEKEQARIAKEKADQSAKLQAEMSAKAEIAKKAEAERLAKEQAEQGIKDQSAKATAPIVTAAYFGLAGDAKSISIFGAVPTEATKNAIRVNAATLFTGRKIDDAGLRIDNTRTMASPVVPTLTVPKNDQPFVAIFGFDGKLKSYGADVFDSEIAADFSAVSFAKGEIAQSLQSFRITQVAAGTIKLDDPYLNMLNDGKTITLAGEIADEASKQLLLAAVKTANPTLAIQDQLAVSPLIKNVTDLTMTINTMPKFQENLTGIAIARPGQVWRSTVIHSIYFPTGSNRSKDQERAILQMQRVKELLPNAKFEIVGHTDNVGKAETNNKLSLDRANAFVTYATAAGIDAALLSARGAGPKEPIAPNENDTGRSLNRRVDVMLK